MASNTGQLAFQARRQALVNLALKRDPIPLLQKPAVSFVADSPPRKNTFEEVTQTGRSVSVMSSRQVTVDELPPITPGIKSTSARSISIISPIL